jgi:hypothetical protein
MDASQTSGGRNEMSDVSRAGRADGSNVRSHQCDDDGRLPELPQGAWSADRLFHVPFVAGCELKRKTRNE